MQNIKSTATYLISSAILFLLSRLIVKNLNIDIGIWLTASISILGLFVVRFFILLFGNESKNAKSQIFSIPFIIALIIWMVFSVSFWLNVWIYDSMRFL